MPGRVSGPTTNAMDPTHSIRTHLAIAVAGGLLAGCVSTQTDAEFVPLFDGKTLSGWRLVGKTGDGYSVKDGTIYCARGGGGNLLSDKEYADFILRLEFKLESGSNNGVGIRAPLEGEPTFLGMEIQILDDNAPQYADLRPAQYCGSIYDVVPARRGALKKAEEWNEEEITCVGRHVKVRLNGQVIVDANLNDVTDPKILSNHPGLLRQTGHVGFLGHNDYIEFRNIRIKELPRFPRNNLAPEGFKVLFDGVNLTGWKGLVETPPKRAKLSATELAAAQEKANHLARQNWQIGDGALVYRGKGFDNLCTSKDYGDFELQVDWKIDEGGDSGIYLRGSPQVQIWDPLSGKANPNHEGSGGLFNNQKNPKGPLKVADYFPGEWNHFDVLMIGDKVTVYLNNELVVHNVTMENYWEPNLPIYPTGQIELQAHKEPVWFRNIYIRELPR
jgi:Domain of Unknown Function (DUF1080)